MPRLALFVYRLTLRLYPTEFRERYEDEIDPRIQELFLSHPFYAGKALGPWLEELLSTSEFEDIFTLN